MILWQIYSGNYVTNFIIIARVLLKILYKHFGLFFPDTLYCAVFLFSVVQGK